MPFCRGQVAGEHCIVPRIAKVEEKMDILELAVITELSGAQRTFEVQSMGTIAAPSVRARIQKACANLLHEDFHRMPTDAYVY